MTAFFEGLIKFFGLFLEGSFWVGLFLIGLFLTTFVACMIGAGLVMSMLG